MLTMAFARSCSLVPEYLELGLSMRSSILNDVHMKKKGETEPKTATAVAWR